MKSNRKITKKVIKYYLETKLEIKMPSLLCGVVKGSFLGINELIVYVSKDLYLPHQVLKNEAWSMLTPDQINLHSASVYSQSNFIYFACGVKENGKPTKKVYFLDVNNPKKYFLADFKLDFKLFCPIVCSINGLVVFAGGKTMEGTCNYLFYSKQINFNSWKKNFGF